MWNEKIMVFTEVVVVRTPPPHTHSLMELEYLKYVQFELSFCCISFLGRH